MQPNHAPDIAARGRTARPSSNELLAVAEHHWPNPGWYLSPAVPEPGGPGEAGWSAAPAGRGPTGTAARPSAWSTRSASCDWAAGDARQPRRRRITPNTNTTTTTMISTHNHVDMAASLVGAGPVQADATAGHPSKQLGHRQATSRARIDGRATRALAGPRHPATCPPIQAGPAADHASAQEARALRATPSQPSRNRIDQHDTSGGLGQASSDPTRPQRADRPDMARPRSVCPAWVGEQSKHGCVETQWQTPRRRRRTDGARLRRNPNLRRGRLHRPALPVQPRSVLRDPPRVGPAGGDSAAHPPARPRSWVMPRLAAGYRGPAGRGWIAGKNAGATSRLEAPTAAATRGRLAARVKVAPRVRHLRCRVRPARTWVSTALAADPW
jgi:hypothetical protein